MKVNLPSINGFGKSEEHWNCTAVKPLSDKEFKKFAVFIYDLCGVKMPPVKKTMLASRLHKRIRRLKLASFSDYYDFVTSDEGQRDELPYMVDVVTTHKTDFFREAKHFDLMQSTILPELVSRPRHSSLKVINVWSAGCSSGEEVYTLAMVLDDFTSKYSWLDYRVLGTDISREVLQTGAAGIYSDEKVEPVPSRYRYKYLMRGKGDMKGCHKVVPELRNKVEFQVLNFMDPSFKIETKMDIIFCRNVIIYFDRKTQEKLFQKIRNHFKPNGYLFTGHSESLEGIVDKMEKIDSAVYRCLR